MWNSTLVRQVGNALRSDAETFEEAQADLLDASGQGVFAVPGLSHPTLSGMNHEGAEVLLWLDKLLIHPRLLSPCFLMKPSMWALTSASSGMWLVFSRAHCSNAMNISRGVRRWCLSNPERGTEGS